MAAMLSTFVSSATSLRFAGARHCGHTFFTASDCVMQLLRTLLVICAPLASGWCTRLQPGVAWPGEHNLQK